MIVDMSNNKVSVVVSMYNEEHNVSALLRSLLSQSLEPDEVLIVDGGSTDSSICQAKSFKGKFNSLSIIKKECFNISQARNFGVSSARNSVIATIDCGCQANSKWLERISKPLFTNQAIDVVSGGYAVFGTSLFSVLTRNYFGLTYLNMLKEDFLPSARSLCFTKNIHERVNGFPEELLNAGEDTFFNHKLLSVDANIVCVPEAYVIWRQPLAIWMSVKKLFSYAYGDGQSQIISYSSGKPGHSLKLFFLSIKYVLILFMGHLVSWNAFILFLTCSILFSFARVKKSVWHIFLFPVYFFLKTILDLSLIFGFIAGTTCYILNYVHRSRSDEKRRS
ncbi:glycosyltransferase [Patescibacteria group bacterium]|nr:glycosyltransferase [Patescibacteria group bacterium]